MAVGLGTGSTVAHLLPALARRGLSGIRCVATSVATESQARELGIPVEDFGELERLDIAIDGADQIAPDGWLIKGGGGAHLREKVVAAAAERFVVIADSSKPVEALSAPVPLELFAFGLRSTLARLGEEVALRDAPRSPDDGAHRRLRRRDRRPGVPGGAPRGRPRHSRPRPFPGGYGQRGVGGSRGRSRSLDAGLIPNPKNLIVVYSHHYGFRRPDEKRQIRDTRVAQHPQRASKPDACILS